MADKDSVQGGDKLGYAGVDEGVTAKDRKLLQAFHELHMDPDIESVEDLKRFMKKYKGVSTVKEETDQDELEPMKQKDIPQKQRQPGATGPTVTGGSGFHLGFQFPKISNFHGEPGKEGMSWETFKFEVDAFRKANTFSEQQILSGIRRAVKGEVGEIVRRLGPEVNLELLMQKLHSTYGLIDSKETVLKKFYSCVQQSKESVRGYSSRLEELFSQACDVGGLRRSEEGILKQVLYQGLRREIKQMAVYPCNTIDDYDRFKVELRKIEADLPEDTREKPCKPVVTPEKSELGEVNTLLKETNDRIKKLEEEKEARPSTEQQNRPFMGSRRFTGGNRGSREQGGCGNGRGEYRPSRQTGASQFQPSCFNCNQKGHLARQCPQVPRITWFNCHRQGHRAKDCPNL